MPHLTRRTVLALAPAITTFNIARAAAPDRVTVAQTSNSLTWAANYIAESEGFFAKHGIEADIQVMSGGDPQVIAAVHSGSAQFGALTTIVALQAIAKGEKLVSFGPFVRQFVAQMVINEPAAAKAGITAAMPVDEKLRRIRGMTVGTLDVGGGLDLLFQGLAKQQGMNAGKDFNETAIHSYPGLLAACKRGLVDVALVGIPFGQLGVQQDGLMMLIDFWNGAVPQFDGAMHSGYYVSTDFAQRKFDLVTRMHAVLGDALAFIHAEPDKAVEDLNKHFPALPASVLTALVVKANGFPAQATVDRHGFDVVRDFVAAAADPKVAAITYDEVILPMARSGPA